MSKDKMKETVKSAMESAAFEFLIQEKNKKSKMANLNYTSLNCQSYLLSDKISTSRKRLLFRARSRMIKVGDNMGNKEELCPACNLELNTQKHITECIVIKMQCHKILANNNDAKYEDIFGDNPEKMNNMAELLEIALRKREQLIYNK